MHSVDRNYSFLITIQPIPIIQQFDSNQYFLTKIMIIKSLAEYTYRESLLTSFFPSRLSDTEKLYAPRLNGISIQMCCVPLKNCCHFPSCSTVHTTCLTVLKHSELDLKAVILNLFPPLPPLFLIVSWTQEEKRHFFPLLKPNIARIFDSLCMFLDIPHWPWNINHIMA